MEIVARYALENWAMFCTVERRRRIPKDRNKFTRERQRREKRTRRGRKVFNYSTPRGSNRAKFREKERERVLYFSILRRLFRSVIAREKLGKSLSSRDAHLPFNFSYAFNDTFLNNSTLSFITCHLFIHTRA